MQFEIYCHLPYSVSLILYFAEQFKYNSVLHYAVLSLFHIPRHQGKGPEQSAPCGNERWTIGWVLSVRAWVRKPGEGTFPISSDPSPKPTIQHQYQMNILKTLFPLDYKVSLN